MSLEQFTGAKTDKKVVAATLPPDAAAATTGAASPPEAASAEPVHVDIPIDMNAADIALETPSADAQNADTPSTEAQAAAPEAVPLPPVAKPVVHRSREEVCQTLTKAAETNHLPVPFFISLLFQESRFQPEVVSSAGAQGIAQFMPETAASMGVDNPFDPLQAIPASARLLKELVSQFGNLGLAAAAYNAGPKRIQDWLGRKSKLPEETQGYVKVITGRPAENWTAANELPGHKLPRRAPCQEAAGLYAWSGPDTIPLPARSPQRVAAMSTEERVAAFGPVKSAVPARAKLLASRAPKDLPKIRVASADGSIDIAPAKVEDAKPVVHKAAESKVAANHVHGKTPSITIVKHGNRVTGIINIMAPEPKASTKVAVKPAAKAVVQLAARKLHKNDKHRLDKVAAR